MPEPLDAISWAVRNTPSLTSWRRSPRQIAETVAFGVALYFIAPDQLMDEVWQLVAVLMAAVLLLPLGEVTVNAFRAPSLALQKNNATLRGDVERLSKEIADTKSPFSINLKHGPIWLLHDEKNLDSPHFYVVLQEVVITNASEKPMSCEAWLRFGPSGSHTISYVAKTESLPEWALQNLGLSPNKQLGRVLNLDGIKSSPVGYLAFKLRKRRLSLLTWHDDAAQQAILTLPRWLELNNLANEQRKLLPLNSKAILADTKRSASRTAAPSPSQGA